MVMGTAKLVNYLDATFSKEGWQDISTSNMGLLWHTKMPSSLQAASMEITSECFIQQHSHTFANEVLAQMRYEPVTQKVPSHVGRIYNYVEVCGDGHDGHVHWVCELAEMGNPKTILAYDLGLETFSEISLPADKNGILYRSYALGVLGGKLCLMISLTNGDREVWILDKYGVSESW
nr:hypothetical protein [Tanacetum cinerariifolium]